MQRICLRRSLSTIPSFLIERFGADQCAILPTSPATWSKPCSTPTGPNCTTCAGQAPNGAPSMSGRYGLADVLALPALASAEKQSSRPLNLVALAASLILGIALFVIALLFTLPTISKADTSSCAQVSDLAAARVRWAAARQSGVDAAQDEKRCRAYRIHFYDAVTARQAASICEDGIHRQRDLDLLDSEIDAFNSLIAAQCGG